MENGRLSEYNDDHYLHDLFVNYENNPVGIYIFKVINRNIRTRRKICSKLAIKTPERRHWRRSSVFIVNSEHILNLALVFLLLNLNM